MSLGSIFVGLAVAIMTIAYIARPFRGAISAADSAAASPADKLIEAWVHAAAVAPLGAKGTTTASGVSAFVDAPVPVTPATGTVLTSTPVVAPQNALHVAAPSVAVNFCPQCGRRVTMEYRFCPGCGALLLHEEGTA